MDVLKKTSLLFLLMCVCFSVILMDLWRPWHLMNKSDNQFKYDIAGYYSYLPSEFIYHNYKPNGQEYQQYMINSPLGFKMTKATYGMALLYSPFFALGYKIAVNERQPLDGFSEPFATCIHWGSILYGLLGLLLLRNFLVKFYSEIVTTITLAVIFFGTNLFYYVLGQSEMTHGYLFFLFAAFLLATYHWYKKITYFKSFIIGLLVGIITLIRPSELIICILFALWMVSSIDDFKKRVQLYLKNYFHIILILFVAFLIWVPQFLIWKKLTGHYLFFSYPGERFFWNDPQIINILFSYRKGWFVYTPLILLSFIGLFFMDNSVKPLRIWIALITIINIYILSCWWDWFFGGSFSGRGFVQHYAYLSIPMASLIKYCLENIKFTKFKSIVQLVFFAIVFTGIFLNIGQIYQHNQGYIHYMSMTKKAYWHVFGKYKLYGRPEAEYWNYLKEPNYNKLITGEDRDQ